MRAENASPRNTAANTKNTTPMPDESRVKSTMAMMKNNSPARALPSACLDMTSPYRRFEAHSGSARRLGEHCRTLAQSIALLTRDHRLLTGGFGCSERRVCCLERGDRQLLKRLSEQGQLAFERVLLRKPHICRERVAGAAGAEVVEQA